MRTQGYESDESVGQDSDDEQDDALNDKQENLAEDDMFGESFETKTKKPKVLQEIEGQEWNADAQDYTEDGVKVEPFNMDQEMEEGYASKQKISYLIRHFDEAGHYIRKKDENVVHDKWLHGLTKSEIEKAKEAHERQRIKAQERDLAVEKEVLDPNSIWCAVLNLLEPGETLVRVGFYEACHLHNTGAQTFGWQSKERTQMEKEKGQQERRPNTRNGNFNAKT